MAVCASVWLSVCLAIYCCIPAASQERCPYLKLKEGDVCKEDSRGPWSCKPLNSCPKAAEDLTEWGETPEICGFKKTEVVVCCEPEEVIEKASESGCKYLDLNEGDVCKKDIKEPWTCKVLKDCPQEVDNLNNDGKEPDICGFINTTVVVCCEPVSKSKQMCKQYAESVFIRLSDTLSGELTNYDTCNLDTRRIQRNKRELGSFAVESKTRQFPHMAVIGHFTPSGDASNITWFCGGSLISDRFILTAAHCAAPRIQKGSPMWVRLGDHNLQSEEDEDKSEAQPSSYAVVETFVHPEFDQRYLYNNIALMKLNTSVYFTEFIRPICLEAHPSPFDHALATAWGKTTSGRDDVLLTLNLTIGLNVPCNDYFQEIGKRRAPDGIKEDQMICAANYNFYLDDCQGDSGGPLQVLLDDPYCMYSLLGVESFSSGCGNENPFVFNRVSHYLPWIENIVWP